MINILIVEDDIALCKGIQLTLSESERDFSFCHTIASAKKEILHHDYDLLILDVNLPDGSGLHFCQEIRSDFSSPILFLTANDTELDIVSGLENGGDDYIIKPFSLAVLRARVNALLRRGRKNEPTIKRIDEFSFDFDNMIFLKQGIPVELSKTEQKLLRLLITNKGITLSRDLLLENIWPDGTEFVEENALSVAIRRLRSKLEENPSDPKYIKTIYGSGYTWAVK